jgi:Tubulin-tyrosine ligase family
VVITNFEKFEFLFWDEFYLRVCSKEYSSNELDLKDNYRHLANNSINKENKEGTDDCTGYHNNIASML